MFTLIAMNLQRAFKKDELLISSTTSMWTAHVVKQVNKIPKRFEQAEPSLVLWVTIGDSPKVSTSTDVNSGPGVSLSSGKSAISWRETGPWSRPHSYAKDWKLASLHLQSSNRRFGQQFQ